MRYVLLLAALWLLSGVATAAPLPADTTATLRVNRLPADGLLLAHGWRYHPGDDPAWARPDFDDSAWDTLNPTRPRRELPADFSKGISWLRLRFRPGDSLRQREVLVQARELGAVEVYLNGRLVLQHGRVSADAAQMRPRGRFPQPGVLPAGGPAEQVLAVRCVAWRPPLLLGLDQNPALRVYLYGPLQYAATIAGERDSARVYLVNLGVMMLLTLLHLAFFRYNPAQRANRYFARYALVAALASVSAYYMFAVPFASFTAYVVCSILTVALAGMIGLWTVRALYDLFHVRPGRVYTALWVAYGGLVLLTAMFFLHPAVVLAFILLLVLSLAEQVRLTGRALRQRQRGAGIVASGFAAGLLVTLVYAGVVVLLPEEELLRQPLSALGFALPALGISLHLAREFALDSQLLQVKLGEVERLSAQTLAQEQEKQALLAAQNETLETQVIQRTGELQRSLTDLRATQAQLIQKEKMASLGELTAGIAHEIQNPLNFVNNFSEVSAELMSELEDAQAAGDGEEVAALAADVRQNLGKIAEHGRRAAGIVRGMLEHSRTSTGERAPTDLNALADEYLRLAYHGLRAKDKTFNATLETDLAADLPLVTAVGADLGRVLLNLLTNAFYAVQQRQQVGEAGYVPTVGVRTVRLNQQVQIQVTDNGTGMPAAVQAKIFQPFFTTKPTGEGTGLGLSLSHDIIAQGHGGTLTVESQEGQGSAFTICLPI